MLKKDELKVLTALFADLTRNWTIRGLSKELNQKYAQAYRTVRSLADSNNIHLEQVGNSKIVSLDFTRFNLNYVIAEAERLNSRLRHKALRLIHKRIINLHENFICLLFGSQAGKSSAKSDFDLLFVIPNEFNYPSFERKARAQLAAYNCDINIVTEDGLLKMWSNPKKFNVGNEILKKHIVMYNGEHFINLLRKHYIGQE